MSRLDLPWVRRAREEETDALAELHRRAFPHYQSTRLGFRFCRRLLRRYASHPECRVFVSGAGNGTPIGYLVAGPPDVQRQINDSLLVWAALAAVPAGMRMPRATARQLQPVARRAQRSVGRVWNRTVHRVRVAEPLGAVPTTPSSSRASVRVILIGVLEEGRGGGISDVLLGEFGRWALAQGHQRADLLVLGQNQPARRAYERNGWVSDEVGDAETVRYQLELGEPEPSR